MASKPAATAAIAAPIPSEEIVARKVRQCPSSLRGFVTRTKRVIVVKQAHEQFDNCLADMVVNTGIGFGVGVVASVLLFRRRGWPVALSTGFGAGVAYSNCNYSLNPYVLPGTKVLPAQRP